ncbi:NAD(P)H-dependent oxidoreductase [Escherichia coli]
MSLRQTDRIVINVNKKRTIGYKESSACHHLAGHPRFPSRSSSLLEYAGKTKWPRCRGLSLESAKLAPEEEYLYARFDSPALKTFTEQLQQADGLIVATPVYKATYSGALKTLLDLLPERALQGKVVLPLATGGVVAHLLAVDYALNQF